MRDEEEMPTCPDVFIHLCDHLDFPVEAKWCYYPNDPTILIQSLAIKTTRRQFTKAIIEGCRHQQFESELK